MQCARSKNTVRPRLNIETLKNKCVPKGSFKDVLQIGVSRVRICKDGAKGGPLYGLHAAHGSFVTPLYGLQQLHTRRGKEVIKGVILKFI